MQLKVIQIVLRYSASSLFGQYFHWRYNDEKNSSLYEIPPMVIMMRYTLP